MEKTEINELAEKIAESLSSRYGACRFSQEEQRAIKDLVRTKRNAVKAFLWICGALTVWVLKDAYLYLVGHLTFR